MKKICLFIGLLSLLIPSITRAEEVDLAPNANSAIIIEATSGEIIWQKNAHEKLPPASMTKIASMLLFMENIEKGNLKWDEEITASENASSMGGSQIFLEAGEKMSVNDMLKGVAIASGNDATVALAERVAGTEEAFVSLMNEKVRELGLKNTSFKNSTGLDIANHYSSAYDMAMLAKELVKHEKILEFTGTYEDYLRKGTDKSFWLVNTNKLVRYYEGVDGLKTGFTNEAGYCLTSTANINGMRLITVVMGEPTSEKRSEETSAMLDYGYNMYEVEKLLTIESKIKNIKINLGKDEYVSVVPVRDIDILNNKTENKRNVTYNISLKNVTAPVKKGDIVGKVEVIENGKVIEEVEVTIENNVSKANFFTVFFRNIKDIIEGDINI